MKFTQKAAAAAGSLAALTAASQDADATIVHVDNNPLTISLVGGPASVDWDVDGQFGREFILARDAFASTSIFLDSNGSQTNGFTNEPLNGMGMVQRVEDAGTGPTVSDPVGSDDIFQRLVPGFVVGPTLAAGYQFGLPYQTNRTILETSGSTQAILGDDAANGDIVGGNNFIGFQFDADGTTLYGWARLDVGTGPLGGPGLANALAGEVIITEWAYEDSGAAIAVGDTGAAAIPEPHSLAMIAMGAAGVAAWRTRRKKQAVTKTQEA